MGSPAIATSAGPAPTLAAENQPGVLSSLAMGIASRLDVVGVALPRTGLIPGQDSQQVIKAKSAPFLLSPCREQQAAGRRGRMSTALAADAAASSHPKSASSAEHVLRPRRATCPSLMTPSARLAELGEILATGARRLRLSLEASRLVERDCPAMEATTSEARA